MTQERTPSAAAPAPDTELEITAASAPEFLALLRKVQARSGRTAGQLAKYTGLPRSTVYNFVSEKNVALPRKPGQVQRFCHGCRLTDAQIDQVMQLWEKLDENHPRKPASEFVFPTRIDLSGLFRDGAMRMMMLERNGDEARVLVPEPTGPAVHTDQEVYAFPYEACDEGTYHFCRERAGFERGIGAALTIAMMALLAHASKWMFSNTPIFGAAYMSCILAYLQFKWVKLITRVENTEQDAIPRRKLLAAIPAACIFTAAVTPFVGPFAGSCLGLVVVLVFPLVREWVTEIWQGMSEAWWQLRPPRDLRPWHRVGQQPPVA